MNFLSTGNEFTTIKLNKSPSTLIYGANGNGKSTILDAITFALFGKAYRNINKPQLINTMTKKGMMVELDFTIGKKNYMVRRGLNPGVFEIIVDGEIMKQDAANIDYQKNFVNNILRFSERSYRQIIVLGSANHQPFMSLPAGNRRQIIEDLLDINIFTTMNNLLKDKINSNKAEITRIDGELRLLENKVELTKKHIESLKQNNDILVGKKKNTLKATQKQITDMMSETEQLNFESASLQEQIDDLQKVKVRIQKLNDARKTGMDKVKQFEKEIKFYHEYDNCPTCKQGISHDFKDQTITKKTNKTQEFSEILDKIGAEYYVLQNRMEEISGIQDQISDINQNIFRNNSTISHLNKQVNDLEEEIKELTEKHDEIVEEQADLKGILQEKKKTEKSKETLMKMQPMFEVCSAMLKDTGIKTRIIKQYIPIMNRLINKYLAIMDFFCEFELDESFNEVIKSRGRDTFSFNSFSEGEKQRISIAILFAWRAIAKMRNSVSTNLLFLDETFDSSTDSAGVDAIMSIITEELQDSNVFIISHNQAMLDKCFSGIEFYKDRGFSKIKVKENG